MRKKKITLPEKCVWVFLSLLWNKKLKTRAITLHGNKTNFCQELALNFLNSLYTKTLKRMQNTLYGETE